MTNKDQLTDGFYWKLVSEGKKQDDEPYNPHEFLEIYYDAYRELKTCICVEGGFIPFTSISEYFKLCNIEGSFEDFLYIIRRMEQVFYEFEENKRKRKIKEDNEKLRKKNNNSVRRPK